jgi:hypothetical protein
VRATHDSLDARAHAHTRARSISRQDDSDRTGRASQCRYRGSGTRQNNIRPHGHEFVRKCFNAPRVSSRPSKYQLDISPFDPSKLSQSCTYRCESRPDFRIIFVPRHKNGNSLHDVALSQCSHWPDSRAAEHRNKLAPSHHSITSSARARSVGESSSPSALADFKFAISSKRWGK